MPKMNGGAKRERGRGRNPSAAKTQLEASTISPELRANNSLSQLVPICLRREFYLATLSLSSGNTFSGNPLSLSRLYPSFSLSLSLSLSSPPSILHPTVKTRYAVHIWQKLTAVDSSSLVYE
ncbi:hypothetical protein TIFTF001_005960 [Ficus carica]|uniref:Uncharacterized protein n=1 Tax=Ficus carica TaxID=3494 RepID=A0AA88A2Z3_FICCA|nr:hypothetical protein TIFTF001_005960 [Ficus carica]